jgi:hypothetical protein
VAVAVAQVLLVEMHHQVVVQVGLVQIVLLQEQM